MALCSHCQGSDGHFWMGKRALVVAQLRAMGHLHAPVLKGSAARGVSVVVVERDWRHQGPQVLGGFWVQDPEVSFAAEKTGVKPPRLRTEREDVALEC